MFRGGEQRLHEVRQQPEALDDDARLLRQAEEIFDDQAEALAPKPVERLQHGLRRPVHPSLVHVHGQELGAGAGASSGVLRRA